MSLISRFIRGLGALNPSRQTFLLGKPAALFGNDATFNVAVGNDSNVADVVIPRRPAGAYIMYSIDVRADIVRSNPNMTIREVQKVISAKWKDLSEGQKERYITAARNDMEAFKAEMDRLRNDPATKDQFKAVLQEREDEKLKRALRSSKVEKKNLYKEMDKPKKPAMAYLLYLKDNFEKAKETLIRQGNPKPKVTDVGKLISQAWKEETEQTLELYKNKYQALNLQYERDVEAWVQNSSNEKYELAREKTLKKIRNIKKKLAKSEG